MTDSITRRDFLNGAALSLGAGLLPAHVRAGAYALEGPPTLAYPPAASGFRGAATASWDAAHALRDGQRFPVDGVSLDERYDLVVVGAGISGLAAAWFYRREKPNARVLLLDALDDFGGHAQRNEFDVGGRRLIGYGGSEALQSPKSLYSRKASGLLRALGVEIDRFETAFDRTLYPGLGLSRGLLFKREHFGTDRLVTGDPTRMVADDIPADRTNARSAAEFVADFPVSEASRRQIVALYAAERDPLRGKTDRQKEALLESISYREWLTRHWGLSEEAANTFQKRSQDFFAATIDMIPASWAMETGYPGFAGLGLPVSAEAAAEMDDPYIYHFPDGNASLARLLVRSLIPGVAPGRGMDDIVLAPFDYSRLDGEGSPIRLRLRSTAVGVRNVGGAGAEATVATHYAQAGRIRGVRSRHVILGCYNMMAPYLMPELGASQREALALNVKAPLVYVNVAVRNWRAWMKRGVHEVTNPMGFYSRLKLDYPVSLGAYACSRSPDQPIVLHLVHVPSTGATGLDQRTEWRAARGLLYSMPFSAFEDAARDELTRICGAGDFDASRDIAGITVNRWGHGYSYGRNPLFDAGPPHGVEPNEMARARIGNVAFANSDSAWEAYAHAAIDEAHRAVGDLLRT
jgi:spermidine dehydrogenase